MAKHFFTSESVTEGHPDKVADNISDAILDAIYEKDPNARVAVECLIKTGFVIVAGEITTTAYIDIQAVVRETLKEIGYNTGDIGFDGNSCGVIIAISEQSPDIAKGVLQKDIKEIGAGDQGLMFGYATNETDTYLPMPIYLAHKLTQQLTNVRKYGKLLYLRPDGKSQVTIEYENNKPKRVDTVVIAAHHHENINLEQLRSEIKKEVINPVLGNLADEKTKYFINGTGSFAIGGPVADAGLTGRKIIVDTYGGMGRHGGGCFSGKDPSKVDRSGSYMARHIAKNIVAAELAEKCEVQLAYAIGIAEPVSVLVETFGTNKIPEEEIAERVKKVFPLRPGEIIEYLNLKRPIYKKTAAYGHFGRDDPDFTWEKTNKKEELKKA
jgi:S-adenosylmethionine synthetase